MSPVLELDAITKRFGDMTAVDALDLEVEGGLTVLTGETGAGKSIILDALGLPPQPFLTSTGQALPTTAALVVWQNLGFQVVLFLAGLAAIPRTYYEAAEIDGASGWQAFKGITWPLLSPTIVFSVVTGTIAYLQLFTQVVNLNFTDQGGPLGSTLTVALYIYQMAFGRFSMGYASAITVVLFGIILLITVFQLKFLTRRYDA